MFIRFILMSLLVSSITIFAMEPKEGLNSIEKELLRDYYEQLVRTGSAVLPPIAYGVSLTEQDTSVQEQAVAVLRRREKARNSFRRGRLLIEVSAKNGS